MPATRVKVKDSATTEAEEERRVGKMVESLHKDLLREFKNGRQGENSVVCLSCFPDAF